MNDHPSGDNLAQRLQPAVMTLCIIVMALASGVLIFAGVAVFLRFTGAMEGGNQAGNLLSFAAIGVVPVAFVVSRVLPTSIARNARGQIASGKFEGFSESGPHASLRELGDAGKLFAVYQTKTIVGAAVLEGAAFFCVVAFLLEGSPIALGLGIGLAMLIMTMFPSPARVAHWIEQQLRLVGEKKSFAG